ncbi:MAG: ribulose-phosphate 3-epimerase [Clostridiales Family XIII bacterium]|jgi:ribulose-phosphate 3-epimerase|nr:ribulose-phosphate 3-epimerase [Clostridiales Family XIII bacterium]
MIRLAPSILSADFSALAADAARVERAGVQLLHMDIMDGHFVPNISFGPAVMKSLLGKTELPFDVHLMIENADSIIPEFVTERTEYIVVHQETCVQLGRTLDLIRDFGVKPGVALNPATPVSALDCVLAEVELVLIMTVNPGYSGQKFRPAGIEKVRRLAEIRKERELSFQIEVDGGVSLGNARVLAEAGTDIFVTGSSLFGAPDAAEWVRAFYKAVS